MFKWRKYFHTLVNISPSIPTICDIKLLRWSWILTEGKASAEMAKRNDLGL